MELVAFNATVLYGDTIGWLLHSYCTTHPAPTTQRTTSVTAFAHFDGAVRCHCTKGIEQNHVRAATNAHCFFGASPT